MKYSSRYVSKPEEIVELLEDGLPADVEQLVDFTEVHRDVLKIRRDCGRYISPAAWTDRKKEIFEILDGKTGANDHFLFVWRSLEDCSKYLKKAREMNPSRIVLKDRADGGVAVLGTKATYQAFVDWADKKCRSVGIELYSKQAIALANYAIISVPKPQPPIVEIPEVAEEPDLRSFDFQEVYGVLTCRFPELRDSRFSLGQWIRTQDVMLAIARNPEALIRIERKNEATPSHLIEYAKKYSGFEIKFIETRALRVEGSKETLISYLDWMKGKVVKGGPRDLLRRWDEVKDLAFNGLPLKEFKAIAPPPPPQPKPEPEAFQVFQQEIEFPPIEPEEKDETPVMSVQSFDKLAYFQEHVVEPISREMRELGMDPFVVSQFFMDARAKITEEAGQQELAKLFRDLKAFIGRHQNGDRGMNASQLAFKVNADPAIKLKGINNQTSESINYALWEMGIQEKDATNGRWRLTEKGKRYGAESPIVKTEWQGVHPYFERTILLPLTNHLLAQENHKEASR